MNSSEMKRTEVKELDERTQEAFDKILKADYKPSLFAVSSSGSDVIDHYAIELNANISFRNPFFAEESVIRLIPKKYQGVPIRRVIIRPHDDQRAASVRILYW